MARRDPELEAHKAWLGLLQPVGLVVSPPALIKAQAVLARNVVDTQQTLLTLVHRPPTDEQLPNVDDFPVFAKRVLGWASEDIAGADGGPDLREDLEVVLPDYGETLRPTYAVVDAAADGEVLMLVTVLPLETPFDDAPRAETRTGWHTSPQAKFERLMREKSVVAGLLFNGEEIRLISAPRGESSGHLTFPVAAMCEIPGRPILAGLHMLLSEYRVFSAPDGRRLLDLLAESRKYQIEVSNKLSEQVLGALWELLRGFQAADEETDGRLIDQTAREDPDYIYGGLLTVLMRLVFLLYAEDQGLMPDDEVYARNYSVTGLHGRLRTDAGRYPDTMDQRYGAWATLLSLFRLVFDGGGHHGFHLPTRHGQLFNPDEYAFLEGRPYKIARVLGDRFEAPRVSDGTIHRVLEALLVLDGERLSYRALDVEQIGSVYEAMMGFRVERAFRPSLGVRRRKKGVDLDIVFDVQQLLDTEPSKRKKWLKDKTECDLTGKSAAALKTAETIDDIVAALGRKISPRTLRPLSPGALYLQPGEERRRSGSHYTPRDLTEPIVSTTLRPVLEALGEGPRPDAILALRVCDPAMGSGAFLVEVCRQLAERLIAAWDIHDCLPELPPDEEPLLHARRLIAQRCLYGVDRNPFAVNLAKLSLWLVTLARDHAFTFLDHALKCGDSLVGLTQAQIGSFDWQTKTGEPGPLFNDVGEAVAEAGAWRAKIQELDEGDYHHRKEAHREAEDALHDARLLGDLVVTAFFSSSKTKDREVRRRELRNDVDAWRVGRGHDEGLKTLVEEFRNRDKAPSPFHWEIEFPEVFVRSHPGFDAIVGNPPFLGGRNLSRALGDVYSQWAVGLHPEASGGADLVAHFYRRSFVLLRTDGAFGLIATNTIRQGDTRNSGLRWICENGGVIYEATTRLKWPGAAAVVVCLVHVRKGVALGQVSLDGREVPLVTAFLFHAGGNEDPKRLASSAEKSFQGCIPLPSSGFLFDDMDATAMSLESMHRLIRSNSRNAERISPYIGGKEINNSPTHSPRRLIIDFSDMSDTDAAQWPDLLSMLEKRVKPERLKKSKEVREWPWWQYWRSRPKLRAAVSVLERTLALNCGATPHLALAFQPTDRVFANTVAVLCLDTYASFCVLQSRPHEIWARFFGSSMKDDLRYTPSDCFETFPFPGNWQTDPLLEAPGRTYYEFRAALMVRNDEGLTKTYNRFHDPEERDSEILRLRDLHAAMDRAVLDAYGWRDIRSACEFFLNYEIDDETWGKKKKPWRYRWPDETHDEVLARLLDLNQKRAETERLSGLTADDESQGRPVQRKKRKGSRLSAEHTLPGFTDPTEDA